MNTTHPAFRRRARSRTRFVVSVGGLFACLGCALFGILAARPFLLAQQLRTQNDAIEREMLTYRLQNQRMERTVKALTTEAGVEREARKLGYVRPNELRLRVPGGM